MSARIKENIAGHGNIAVISQYNNMCGQKSIVPTIRDGILDNAEELGYEAPDPRGYFFSQK
jgi:hypothetical protein